MCDDAAHLREAGSRQTILLLEGFFSLEDLKLIAEYDLATVIHNEQQLASLDAYPRRGNLQVWLKVNSGMNRLGFMPEEVPAVMERLKSHSAVRDVTLMTHFSHADEAEGVSAQLERFNGLTSAYRASRSMANSARFCAIRPRMVTGCAPVSCFMAHHRLSIRVLNKLD
jgi:alanine racemase